MSEASKLPQIDMSYFCSKGHTALSELMRAIMLRAIEDYHSHGSHREEAQKYFYAEDDFNEGDNDNEDDEYIFSFRSICKHFEIDPDKTREAIVNAQKKISTRRRSV